MKIRKKLPNEKGGFHGYSFTPKSGNIELREEAILNCVAYRRNLNSINIL